MMIGRFELNLSDSEIRYKTSIEVEGASLSFAFIVAMFNWLQLREIEKWLCNIEKFG